MDVLPAVETAALTAASHDWLLTPMTSVTRYTLSAINPPRLKRTRESTTYGVVVDSVERQRLRVGTRAKRVVGADRPLKLIATGLGHGPLQVFRGVGLAEPPTGAYVASVCALACRVDGSENAPLTRWPVAVLLGSATVEARHPRWR